MEDKINYTRLFVIEKTISIEEHISETIGHLLNIDWRKSKSLGFSSSSLDFSRKVQIIQDILDISGKEDSIKKLTRLMEIRNKFAHVSEIISFEKLFSSTKVGKKIKEDLKNWYLDVEEDNEEKKYKKCFLNLTNDITRILKDIEIKYLLDKLKEDIENNFNKSYSELLVQEILKLEGGKEINNRIIDEVMQKTKNKK
ncbi:hypothetical protein [Tenacibaculum ovolyticum]|uniref:hypothetical protein n=1 Tax=Tenacibaculum ovolyticum TaxID=104270 RepID=UPI001F41436A|nr:hypothetical protein [Tenacibaculum ovolyticum]